MFQKRGRISYTVSEPHICAVSRPPIQILKKRAYFPAGAVPQPRLINNIAKIVDNRKVDDYFIREIWGLLAVLGE